MTTPSTPFQQGVRRTGQSEAQKEMQKRSKRKRVELEKADELNNAMAMDRELLKTLSQPADPFSTFGEVIGNMLREKKDKFTPLLQAKIMTFVAEELEK